MVFDLFSNTLTNFQIYYIIRGEISNVGKKFGRMYILEQTRCVPDAGLIEICTKNQGRALSTKQYLNSANHSQDLAH